MEFDAVIKQRRSLRSFAPVEVSDAVIRELAGAASRAPSCSNKQPWRFAFVRSPGALERMLAVLAPGNAVWAKQASLIVAVWSLADLDCRTPDGRDYYQFDTGMATALLLLAATERNLITHPVAGFDPHAAQDVLALPEQAQVITLIMVGGRAREILPELKDWQIKAESEPSPRMPFEDFATIV
jgi:nitroreductase